MKNSQTMKAKLLSALIVCMFALQVYSGDKNGNHGIGYASIFGKNRDEKKQNASKGKKTNKKESHGGIGVSFLGAKPADTKQKIKSSKDSVFYLNVTKRFGWPEGIGAPLKKEDLSHIPVYFVLSNKNKAGKWTYMRAFDAYGKLTTNHSWGAYILNPNDEYDENANSQWGENLKNVCQWEFISDANGKEVVQERALDANDNVVFCYNIVKVAKNKRDTSTIYSGSYTDAYAMPIFMRTDSTGDYKGQANFVQIKRDKRGYDIQFAFTDETGRICLNKDGAYQTRKDYDVNGRQIREASLDLVGNQMTDFYGNCGWQNVVDAYGSILKANYFGANNEPIQMPGTRGSDKVYGYEFLYDMYHRETDRWYLVDSIGNRGLNEYGVYHAVSRYGKHGERELLSYYDKDGKLTGGDEYGIAQVASKYDDKGNLLFIEWQDKDGKQINGYGDFCSRMMTYDTGGNVLSQIDYWKNENDSIIERFKYVSDGRGNEIRYWFDEGRCRVDSVDAKGRTTLEAWYDLEHKPIAKPDEGQAWHKHITTYNDENNTEVEELLDTNGTPYINLELDNSNKYNYSIDQNETSKNIITSTQYLNPIGLIQKFQKQYDDQGNIIAQWDVTPYGEHARVGWWNNLHYKCNVTYNMYGKIRNMIGVNEFDEPSYLVNLNDESVVYYYNDFDNYYDEYSHVIPSDSMAAFKERLPKAFCVEVTDTAIAYPLGFRNGDIILSYGDWAITEDLRTNINYFYLETILKNHTSKKVIVLRHDISTKTSSIVELDLPSGKPSELGFYPHMIYYTQKEAYRLHDACHKYHFTYGLNKEPAGKQVLMGIQLKGGVVQTRFYHFSKYDYKDPGLLLYASEKYSNGTDVWSVANDSVGAWENKHMYDSQFSGKTELYLTQDFKTVKKLSKSSAGNRGLIIVPIFIPDEMYDRLIKCYSESQDISNMENKQKTAFNNLRSIKAKDLVGIWTTSVSENDITLDIKMILDKKKKIETKTIIKTQREISEGVMLKLQVSVAARGYWFFDNEIIIDYDVETKDVTVDTIDVIGGTDELKQQFLNYIEENKSEFTQTLIGKHSEILLPTNLVINEINKKEMNVVLYEEKNVIFKKK